MKLVEEPTVAGPGVVGQGHDGQGGGEGRQGREEVGVEQEYLQSSCVT